MFVLGLQGSPRRRSNTRFLLERFLARAAEMGADTHTVEVEKSHIEPCRELIACEKKGFCPIRDDMESVYGLLRRADVVVAATPIFFYNATAQLKALIDRCQTLWARKYRFRLKDPGAAWRRGYLLAVAATRGKNLFEGLNLTTQYFFDAVDAEFVGGLTYPAIEKSGDMSTHPTAAEEIRQAAEDVLHPLTGRRRVLFLGAVDACRSQMAAAWARQMAGDRLDTASAGCLPAEKTDPAMVRAMAAQGIDMAFLTPRAAEGVFGDRPPERVVAMDADAAQGAPQQVPLEVWDLPASGEDGGGPEELAVRIRERVRGLVDRF